jgi:hypothetical protein
MAAPTDIPIIFVQAGRPKEFLDIALRQAALASPSNQIILLSEVRLAFHPRGATAMNTHRVALSIVTSDLNLNLAGGEPFHVVVRIESLAALSHATNLDLMHIRPATGPNPCDI